MQVTEVRIRKVNQDGSRMKAVCSVTFDNEFVVHDIKIVEGERGLFIAMPSRKTPAGEFRDIAHPINSDTRKTIQEATKNIHPRIQIKIGIKYFLNLI
jgi:stage V sporulation protein G